MADARNPAPAGGRARRKTLTIDFSAKEFRRWRVPVTCGQYRAARLREILYAPSLSCPGRRTDDPAGRRLFEQCQPRHGIAVGRNCGDRIEDRQRGTPAARRRGRSAGLSGSGPPAAAARPNGARRAQRDHALSRRPAAALLSGRRPRQIYRDRPEQLQGRTAGTRIDLLDRRRHRVLFLRARFARPERPAAAGGGADRRNGQLFPLRLCRADRREPALPLECRGLPEPLERRSQARADRNQGLCDRKGRTPARQPRLPDRHVGIDERPEQAPAGQTVARDAPRPARRRRPGGDRHLCRQRGHRARADPGEPEGQDPRRA